MARLGEKLNYAKCNLHRNLKFPGRSSKFFGFFYQIQGLKLTKHTIGGQNFEIGKQSSHPSSRLGKSK